MRVTLVEPMPEFDQKVSGRGRTVLFGKKMTHKVLVVLPDDLAVGLAAEAKRRGVKTSTLAREFIKEGLRLTLVEKTA